MVTFVLESSSSSKKDEFAVVICGFGVRGCFLKQSFLGFLR